jgi:hypothetical protein
MAHTVINGASPVVTSHPVPLVDQIADAIDQIDQYVANLLAIRNVLQPLEALRSELEKRGASDPGRC